MVSLDGRLVFPMACFGLLPDSHLLSHLSVICHVSTLQFSEFCYCSSPSCSAYLLVFVPLQICFCHFNGIWRRESRCVCICEWSVWVCVCICVFNLPFFLIKSWKPPLMWRNIGDSHLEKYNWRTTQQLLSFQFLGLAWEGQHAAGEPPFLTRGGRIEIQFCFVKKLA